MGPNGIWHVSLSLLAMCFTSLRFRWEHVKGILFRALRGVGKEGFSLPRRMFSFASLSLCCLCVFSWLLVASVFFLLIGWRGGACALFWAALSCSPCDGCLAVGAFCLPVVAVFSGLCRFLACGFMRSFHDFSYFAL